MTADNEPDGPAVRAQGVARPASSDDDLLRGLYAEHAGALLGYALRLLDGDRQRAEDVVQETLLRAWRHPEALAPERGDVRPWLFTVARRLVIDDVRGRRARPHEVGAEQLAVLPAVDELDRALEAWQVAEALESLTPDHRTVIVELYYLGQSVRQAAATMGIPIGTVKSRAFYALRGLRLALQERGLQP